MHDACLSAGCVESNSTQFKLTYLDASDQERVCVEQRTRPMIESLRQSLTGGGESNDNGRAVALTTTLQQAFSNSSYGLVDVQCVINRSTVHLFGIVRSYFALQMAIQLARGAAETRRITLNVDVVPRLYEAT